MKLGKINYLAILVVVILHLVLGFLWFGPLFGDSWMEGARRTVDEFANPSPVPFVISMVGSVLFCLFLQAMLTASGDRGVGGGIKWGVVLWALVILPFAWTLDAFSLNPLTLTAIEAGHGLVALILAGAIIGVWRPRRS